MTPQVFDFIPGLLEYTDTYIEVAGGYHITAKKKITSSNKYMCYDNGNHFIATLHNVLLALDLCNRLFSIITLINLGHTCLFRKGFSTAYFGDKEKNAVTLTQSAQRKHAFLGVIKKIYKSNKIAPRKKTALELLHHILEHISTRSLMDGYSANVWQDI